MSTLESTTFDETLRCASKWLVLTQKTQNLESVNVKCVAYAQPIPLSLSQQRTQWFSWYMDNRGGGQAFSNKFNL